MSRFFTSFLRIILLVLALAGTTAYVPASDSARADYTVDPNSFVPELLISDSDFTNPDAMGAEAVNQFLAGKGSWLANYTIPEYMTVPYFCRNDQGVNEIRSVSVRQIHVNGSPLHGMRAADLLVQRAVLNGVNPQVILSLIERESSGITRGSPSSDFTRSWPLFYGYDEKMASYGYTCGQAEAKAADFGGVGLQLAYAPFGIRNLYNNTNSCPNNQTVDGRAMSLHSRGTAALYCYTPHIYPGNYNFWYNFNRWFPISTPPAYKPKALVRNTEGGVFLADNNKLWHITSADAFLNFGFNWGEVIPIAGSQYAAWPFAGPLSRLISASDGHVFLIENAKKRSIMSARIFEENSFSWGDITRLDDNLLMQIPEGIPVWELARVAGTSGVYIMSHGENHHVPNPQVFQDVWKFRWEEISDVPLYVLRQFPNTRPLSRLVKANDGRVYYLNNGTRYHIADPDSFAAYRFSWDDVIAIDNNFVLKLPYGGRLSRLVGAPNGAVYYIENGTKRYVSLQAFTRRGFRFDQVSRLDNGVLNTFPNGSNL
jgi:hypothetical protein